MSSTATSSTALERRRRADVKAAWRAYQLETKGLEAARYDEVEPWAWARLQHALRLAGT